MLTFLSVNALCGASSLGRLPLSFEPGVRSSEFFAHAGDLNVTLTPVGATLKQGSMRLIGARSSAAAQPEELLHGYSNYLLDRDPRQWRTHVLNYRRVRYRDVYPGIDVVYYGNGRELEFDFIVAPGADARRIRITLGSPSLLIRLPRIYQGACPHNGSWRRESERSNGSYVGPHRSCTGDQNDRAIGGYAIRRGNRVTFEVAAYDHSRPLIIDPVLSYASTFGGGGSDEGRAIAVDSTGSAYVIGNASDTNFPVVNGKSGQSSFLAKLTPAGDALVYSTYLRWPGSGPASYAIDSSGSVFVVSTVYQGPPGAPGPPVVGPLQNCPVGGPPNLYIAKLSADGTSMIYSGCIGGAGFIYPNIITVDGASNAYVAGNAQVSTDFPLVNPLPSSTPAKQGPPKAFVLKLGPDGALLYSTFFGGSNGDSIRAVAADPMGNIYLTGQTSSPDFPLKNAIQTGPSSFNSAFVAKINAAGSDMVYSTYLGESNFDSASAIATDAFGNAYVAGSTTSANFPTTSNALQKRFNGVFFFKSTNGAGTWSASDSGLPGIATYVQVDPGPPSTIYAVSGGGIFKSLDRGATWRGTSAAAVNSLWIDPADSSLYIGTSHGDFVRSRDRGNTFTGLDTGLGGYPNQMAFDPKNALVIYGRWGGHGSTDGVYKSIDGGDTWKPTGLVGLMNGSGPLAIDPVQPSTLYAEARNRGLVRSTNGGDTWTTIGGDVTQVVVDAKSTVYSVSGSTINILPPGGVTVQKVAPASVGTLVIDPTNSSIWYAITSSSSGAGLYKSTDSGDTWQSINGGLPTPPLATSLAVDPSTPKTLYLGMSASTDGFFTKLSPDGASLEYSTYLGGSSVDSVNAIAVDAAGNAYLAGTTDSTDFPLQTAFRTSGSGFTAKFDSNDKLVWSSLLGGATPHAIALGPAGEVYLTGSSASDTFATPGALGPFVSGNFFRTADGGTTWTGTTLTTSTTSVTSVTTLAVDPKTPSHVFALADHLYGSNDGGQTWTQLGTPGFSPYGPLPFGPSLALVLDPLTPTTMYEAGGFCTSISGVSGGCGVSKSTDGGVTWTTYPITPNQPPTFGTSLAIDPKTPSTLYAAVANGGIYKSTDAAATWSLSGSLMTAGAVAVDPLNPSIVYASIGSSGPPSLIPPGALTGGLWGLTKSTDAGATWTTITNGLPSGWFASILVVDPAVPGRVYAEGSFTSTLTRGLYRSDNGGNNWMAIGSGLPDSPINALAVDPANLSVLYAASSAGGVYHSVDAGANWTPMPGLQVPIVNAIAVDPSDSSRIYAGTQTNPGDAFVMKIIQ